jgi:hypothetical protein
MKLPQTSKPTTSKPHKNRKAIIIVLTVLAIAFVGLVLFKSHQDQVKANAAFEADKARFAAIESDLDGIRRSATKDVDIKGSYYNKTCSHVVLKFEKGALNCTTTLNLITSNPNKSDVISRIANTIKTSGVFDAKPMEDSSIMNAQNNKQELAFKFYSSEGITCSLSESGYVSDGIAIRCNGLTSKPVYTLVE